MSAYGSKDVGFVLVDGIDITSNVLGLTPSGSEPVTDKIVSMGAQFPTVKDTGQRSDMGLMLDVLYDDIANNVNAVLVGSQGVARLLLWCITGNVIGRRFDGIATALTGKTKRLMSDGKLHRGQITYEGNGAVEEGIILHAYQQEGAAGNTQGTSHDWTTEASARSHAITSGSAANPTTVTASGPHGLTNGDKVKISGASQGTLNGTFTATVLNATQYTVPVNLTGLPSTGGTGIQASTPNGGAGYFAASQLTLGGFTNFQAKVRHSVDNSTFADLVTFSTITTVPAKERIFVAGVVNEFLASSWIYNGAGGGQSCTFVVGFARADANT